MTIEAREWVELFEKLSWYLSVKNDAEGEIGLWP